MHLNAAIVFNGEALLCYIHHAIHFVQRESILNVILAAALDLISISGRGALYCSSLSLIEARNQPTLFCSITSKLFALL